MLARMAGPLMVRESATCQRTPCRGTRGAVKRCSAARRRSVAVKVRARGCARARQVCRACRVGMRKLSHDKWRPVLYRLR